MTHSKTAQIRTAIAEIAALFLAGCMFGDHGVKRMTGAGARRHRRGVHGSTAGSGKPGVAATVAGTVAGLFPGSGIGASLDKLYAARTRQAALEISRKSWVVGIKSPVNDRICLHTLEAANVDALRDLIERHRAKAEQVLDHEVRVLNCYEAGYEGFWLARRLDGAMALETVVLDPASLLVNRKAKQHKTDRIDAKKMVRALLAHDRGDTAVLSRVRVPSVEEEDRKRLHRERQRLVKERTSLTNSIKGLLKLHGIFDVQPRSKDFEAKFADVATAYGSPLPPRAR